MASSERKTFTVGQMVTYTPPRDHDMPKGFIEGQAYEVVEYEPNDTGWPSGCTGTPFVTIVNESGTRLSGFDYHFKEII